MQARRRVCQTKVVSFAPTVFCRIKSSNAPQARPVAVLTYLQAVEVNYLERGITDHLASGIEKSFARAMAVLESSRIGLEMKMNTYSITSDEGRSYTQLQQQIHDALRVQHPEWVEPDGDCPTCESYESRFAQLLGVSSPAESH